MLNCLISFDVDINENLARAGAALQNLEWVNSLNKSQRGEFLYMTYSDEDGIVVMIMLVNIDKDINQIKEFVDNEMLAFFEWWEFGTGLNGYRDSISDFITGIWSIDDLEVKDNYENHVMKEFDFLEFYDYNTLTNSIPDAKQEKEMIELMKTVYYDYNMEWLLLEDNQRYFEQNKEKYFQNQKL